MEWGHWFISSLCWLTFSYENLLPPIFMIGNNSTGWDKILSIVLVQFSHRDRDTVPLNIYISSKCLSVFEKDISWILTLPWGKGNLQMFQKDRERICKYEFSKINAPRKEHSEACFLWHFFLIKLSQSELTIKKLEVTMYMDIFS